MKTQEVTVTNPLGLHARAAAQLVATASRYSCSVSIAAKGRRVSARSILAVLLLAATVGTTVQVEVDGPDEATAMREVAELFQTGFGELS